MVSKNPGWEEKQKQIMTKKGLESKAPRHYEVSVKKNTEGILRQPLVMIDEGSEVKIVEKAIEAKNPIEQFKERIFVYQGNYTIIREVLQNSERIGRDRSVPVNINMTFDDNSFTIEDSCGGVTKKNIDVVFKLGASGYETLGVETTAFGEGFISFIKLFGKVEVISNDVNSEFDWDAIEKAYKDDPKFDMMKAYKVAEYPDKVQLKAEGKFIAKFTKPLAVYNKEKAIKIAKEVARTMQVNSITINGELLNNRLDFKTVPSGYREIKKKYGEKDGIEGWFTAGTEKHYMRMYDNGAPVGSISSEIVDNRYVNLPAISGVVNLKHTFYGQANKARDGWIQDERIERTERFIFELAKELAIDIIKYSNDSEIEQYQHFISTYTTFEDIKYHIRFDVIESDIIELITKSEREKFYKEHPEEKDENKFKKHIEDILKSPSKLTEAVENAKDYSKQLDSAAYNEKKKQLEKQRDNLQQEQQSQPASETTVQETIKEKQEVIEDKQKELEEDKDAIEKKQKTVDEKIKEFLDARSEGGLTFAKYKKNTFWCKSEEVEKYAEVIKTAAYYKINIAIAKNKFQRQGFEAFDNFVHISKLESSIQIVPKIPHAGAQNAKERRIEFIIRAFLDAAGYNNIKVVLADIIGRRVIRIQGTNKKMDEEFGIVAYAEHQTNSIFLQRKIGFGTADGTTDFTGVKALYPFLEYNDFPIESKSIGMGDIAVFSKIRKTLSHELAHLVEGTKDNTADHYKAIIGIDQKFDIVIAEFKASSRISDSLEGLNKKARERVGVQTGDKVVITVTKGTEGQVEKQAFQSIKKATMNDIYRHVLDKKLFTYRQLIERYDDIEDLQKAIHDGIYAFTGWKIGDYVLVKNNSGDEVSGKIKKIGSYESVGIELDKSLTTYFFDADRIIRVIEKTKRKYLKGEIFVDETGKAKTYAQILDYYDTGDFPIESGQWKPTGLRIGDMVKYNEYETEGSSSVRAERIGKIKDVNYNLSISRQYEDSTFSAYFTYREVNEVTRISEPSNQLSFDDLIKGG